MARDCTIKICIQTFRLISRGMTLHTSGDYSILLCSFVTRGQHILTSFRPRLTLASRALCVAAGRDNEQTLIPSSGDRALGGEVRGYNEHLTPDCVVIRPPRRKEKCPVGAVSRETILPLSSQKIVSGATGVVSSDANSYHTCVELTGHPDL